MGQIPSGRAARAGSSQSRLSRITSLLRGTNPSPDIHETFFRYTSGRWLYNEQAQMSSRYVRFDVEALKRVAADAVGAKYCKKMRKTHEGSFNKVFSLTFDNGAEVVAKIPFPLTGPTHLATASEVATMEYARTILDLPVPKVIAWCSRASKTAVGTEYIIMEKVRGVELHQRWADIRGEDTNMFLDQVNAMERKFAERSFSQIGSIFYKEDVEPHLQSHPLYADGVPADEAAERFRIGPLVQWDMWRGSRSLPNADTGPWPDAASYVIAIIRVAKKWLDICARPRPADHKFYWSSERNSLKAHIRLLDQFQAVVPHILPQPVLCSSVLWHTDLHAGNIMVSASGKPEIVGILDWQGMTVAPLFMQATFASFARYCGDARIVLKPGPHLPQLPPDFDELPEGEQKDLLEDERMAKRHKHYEYCIRLRSPRHLAVLTYPHMKNILLPIYCASRTWREGLYLLREHLVELQASWDDIAPGVAFPVSFSLEELEHHREDHGRMKAYEERVARLSKQLCVDGDCRVPNEHYEDVKQRSDECMRNWDTKIGPYPFQDGAESYMVCEQHITS